MKEFMTCLGLACALAAVGCGGSKKADTTPKVSPCVAAGANVAAQLNASVAGQDDTTKHIAGEIAPVMQKVMVERCQADAWSAAAIDCVTKADAVSMDACTKQLTPEQSKALEDAMRAEVSKLESLPGRMQLEPGATESAPAAAPAGAPPDDPCGGGE